MRWSLGFVAMLGAWAALAVGPPPGAAVGLSVDCADPDVAVRSRPAIEAVRGSVIEWFRAHGFEVTAGELVTRAEVFTSSDAARRRLAEVFHVPTGSIPEGFSGTVDGTTLYVVSPEVFRANFARLYGARAWQDGEYAKLIAHELIHRGHALVATRLFGSEDGMGPQWLFEGLAITAAAQLPVPESEVRAVTWLEFRRFVEQADGGAVEPPVYPKYSKYFAYLLQAADYRWIIANAGHPDLLERVERLVKSPAK